MPHRRGQPADPYDVTALIRSQRRRGGGRATAVVDEVADGPRPVGRPRGSTRERILDAALDLFTDNGYDKTSLREIADKLGFTKAALYYHFEHKEDILMALHLRLHALGKDAMERLNQTEGATTDVAVWADLLNRFLEEVLENRKLFLFHVRNFNALTSLGDRHQHDAEHEDMEEQLSKLLANTDLPLVVRVRMACALGAVFGALMQWGGAFTDVDPDEMGNMVRAAVDDVLRPVFPVRAPAATKGGRAPRRPPRRPL